MEKDKYCRAKELARQVLWECGVPQLPVDPTDLCRKYGITVKTYIPKTDNPGQAYILNGNPIILVSATEQSPQQRFICAHELGHILMGHVGQWREVPDNRTDPYKERAAMIFAAELLMPQCVLMELEITTIDQIMKLCGVPYRSAFYALKEIQRRKQCAIRLLPMERQLCKQFGLCSERGLLVFQ